MLFPFLVFTVSVLFIDFFIGVTSLGSPYLSDLVLTNGFSYLKYLGFLGGGGFLELKLKLRVKRHFFFYSACD